MKIRKLIAAFICITATLVAALALSACSKPATPQATLIKSEYKLIVIRAEQTTGSLKDALKLFQDEGKLTYTYSESQYGEFVTSINGYTPDDSKKEFCAVYTSLTVYDGVTYSTTEHGSYEYDGKKLGSASYGVSGLPLVEGEIYLMTISTY